MTTEAITTDLLIGGVSGTAIGFGIGWTVKKAFKLLFKFIIVLAIFYVGSLLYLKSQGVININEKAGQNLIDNSVNNMNNFLGATKICDDNTLINSANMVVNEACLNDIVTSPTSAIHQTIASLGLPLTTGLGFGMLLGWSKG
ncbi:MAG TPA: FUN14 domain-containing protein [Nitrososphaeraceae archaeon]|nr:FUN14 domain-containing protein [Nitrososphaeraceae archaeon]